ncbi:MAG: hypothetical protein HYZ86_05330 [Candidatus Omnitrophica bacterium]|nr:hypothetical protein [Candidatus Omnitrophota bacterium]
MSGVEQGQATTTGTMFNIIKTVRIRPADWRQKFETSEKFIDVHSHPVSLEKGFPHVAPEPSEGDIKAWESGEERYAAIVWGHEGSGYYLTLINPRRRSSGLWQMNAFEFYRLKKVTGDVYDEHVVRTSHRFLPEKINEGELEGILKDFKEKAAVVKESEEKRKQNWEARAYKYYQSVNKEYLADNVKFENLDFYLDRYFHGVLENPQAEGNRTWHDGRNLKQAIYKEIARLNGLKRTLIEAGNDEFKTAIQAIEQRGVKVEEVLRRGFGGNPNAAMLENTGGIDLNVADDILKVQNQNGEIKFNVDPAMLEQFRNVPGFVPVIINVQPMNNLKVFLGISD